VAAPRACFFDDLKADAKTFTAQDCASFCDHDRPTAAVDRFLTERAGHSLLNDIVGDRARDAAPANPMIA
jgi:hypothetical protein